MRYKIVCTYKYLHLEPLVSVILRNIYILYLFINIGIIIFVSFEEDKNDLYCDLFELLQNPQRI